MDMAKQQLSIKWDLLREAYAAIRSSVNDDILQLQNWKCGTLACAAGHLAQMPKFYELGLQVRPIHYESSQDSADYCVVYREAGRDGLLYNFTALMYFFGLRPLRADELFGQRTAQEKLDLEKTDKDVWLSRMREFFAEHNQPLEE